MLKITGLSSLDMKWHAHLKDTLKGIDHLKSRLYIICYKLVSVRTLQLIKVLAQAEKYNGTLN